MKSFTDISQSKKLAEMLSNKTSDMYYWCGEDIRFGGDKAQDKDYDIPAWSLVALLNVLPASCDDGRHCFALINSNPNGDTEWLCCYEDADGELLYECYADNQIDACVEMILKLHEQNLLQL